MLRKFFAILTQRGLKPNYQGKINSLGMYFNGSLIKNAKLLRQSRGLGIVALFRSALFGTPDLTSIVVSRGTSIREAKGTPPVLKGASPEEIALHTMLNESNAVSFTDKGSVARRFSFLNIYGAICMYDTRGLRFVPKELNKELSFSNKADDEWSFQFAGPHCTTCTTTPAEFEVAAAKSIPPVNFIGYQRTLLGVSIGKFIWSELYVDPSCMHTEYGKTLESYIQSFQDTLTSHWVKTEPKFKKEEFDLFIKNNTLFYQNVNKILKEKRNITNAYNIDEIEKYFKEKYGKYQLGEEEKIYPNTFCKGI